MLLTPEQIDRKRQMAQRFLETHDAAVLEKALRILINTTTSPEKCEVVLAKYLQYTSENLTFDGGEPDIVCIGDVENKDPEYMWEGAIPMNTSTLLPAPGAEGKTTLMTVAAALVSQGEISRWGGRTKMTAPARVLIICGEDEWGSMLKPTLLANGADLSRVFAVCQTQDKRRFHFNNPDVFRRAYDRVQPAFVLIDNVNKYASQTHSGMGSPEVYEDAGMVQQLSAEYECATVMLHHVSVVDKKAWTNSKINFDAIKSYGSTGWPDSHRSVLQMCKEPGNRDTGRVVWQSKLNGAVRLQPRRFSSALVAVPGFAYQYYTMTMEGLYVQDDDGADTTPKPATRQDKYDRMGVELLRAIAPARMDTKDFKGEMSKKIQFLGVDLSAMRKHWMQFKTVSGVDYRPGQDPAESETVGLVAAPVAPTAAPAVDDDDGAAFYAHLRKDRNGHAGG